MFLGHCRAIVAFTHRCELSQVQRVQLMLSISSGRECFEKVVNLILSLILGLSRAFSDGMFD